MSDTSVRMSRASCSDIGQFVLGAWASGLRTAPKRPTSRWAKPFCSLFSDSVRSEEHTSELQSHLNLVCRLLLEKKNHAATQLQQPYFGRSTTRMQRAI